MDETSGPAILGIATFLISITIIIVFFVLANNISLIRKEAEKQRKFLRLLSMAAPGAIGMIGQTGTIQFFINPPYAGRVRVFDEDWDCVASEKIEFGASVVIKSVNGLALVVEPVKR